MPGNLYLTAADRAAIDVKNGGKYVCVQTETGSNGGQALLRASAKAANRCSPVRLLRGGDI